MGGGSLLPLPGCLEWIFEPLESSLKLLMEPSLKRIREPSLKLFREPS